ncbi:MAG TPA: tetratricopeptide repeat-containing serine protease family protein [Candidatus Limnocylindrales bacterium]|nr:tetratricopeptide repeat-containing serine protease family protein [Candidatus Limnocylindrales bacterium]
MKPNRFAWIFLWLMLTNLASAQQSKSTFATNPPATNAARALDLRSVTTNDLEVLAEKGDAEAQFELGKSFFGNNDEEATKWLLKAAEQNHKKACFYVGYHFLIADSPDYNPAKAFDFFLRGAKLGDSGCDYFAGDAYLKGNGTATNITEGIHWIEKSADQGYATAQLDLARRYYAGDALAKNLTNAIHYYELTADNQHDDYRANLAQRTLDFIYSTDVTNDVEAAKWCRKAAEGGDEISQYNLGVKYENGNGVSVDYAESGKWYQKAADQDFAPAEANLGGCYHDGQGVPRDFVESVRWWRKAAEQGNAVGEYNLGACYANGEGIPKNYLEAYKWINLASAQDYDVAKKFLPILERRMTPEQIAEAQQLSAKFVPRAESSSNFKPPSPDEIVSTENEPKATGTGFFITDDGYLISNYHVIKDAMKVRLVTGAGLIDAKVVQVDAANDLALLKADGRFAPLPIAASRTVNLGGTVATVGFPDPAVRDELRG